MSAASALSHRPRYITRPGGVLVCIDCGTPLELTCAKGHNPAAYMIEPDPQHAAAIAPAPKRPERGQSKTPPPATGICECGAEFVHVKRRGRRHTRCPSCR